MANKTLTARVRLDTKSAEASLSRLAKKINNVQSAINKTSRKSGLEQQVNKAVLAQEKLKQATLKTQLAEEKLTAQKHKTALAAQKVKDATDKSANSANRLDRAFRSSQASANGLLTTIKRLAATYLGIMGMKAIVNTSDIITSTQNKLNNLNGGDANLTQEQMDKMYASANKVRMAYTDMLANASKSMTLAGDAFQGNMDNAIRFQEIMAETYALGGASAAEMSSSMYQMIQALGAGILAGDELRSVREGAPLAYKAIEEFAQGVYNTEESLKDLASQGKITSEMVVAAIMNAGDRIDEQFEKTSMTFGQAWDRIKNAAVKAFEPVSKMLNDMLNEAAENGAFEKIESAFWNISKALQMIFKVIEATIKWIADNWEWLKHLLIGGLILYASYLIITTGVAIAQAAARIAAWLSEYGALLLIVGGVLMLIYVFYLWQTEAISTCDAIGYAVIALGLIIVGVLIMVGVIATAGALLIALAIIAVIALIILYFAEFCGYVNVGIQAIVNAWFWCANLMLGVWNWVCTALANALKWLGNLFMGCFEWIGALFYNCGMGIANTAMAIFNVISVVCKNIGIAFENCWIWAQNSFWSFMANVFDGLSAFAEVIDAIASVLGVESFSLSAVVSNAKGKQQGYKSFNSVGNAWASGMNTFEYKNLSDAWNSGNTTFTYESLSDAWSSGWNTYDPFQEGWAGDAYDQGFAWGSGIENKVNEWGSQFKLDIFNGSIDNAVRDKVKDELGIDLSGFPNANDPAYDVGGAYQQPDDLLKDLADIANDTSDIRDSMELTEEDLEYLRKLAAMEWKKEYTSNTITIDMSNYNTINNDSDLDGIVTKLSDKLYEEMNILANGVYA